MASNTGTAYEHYCKGNEAFVMEKYDLALSSYSQAIAEDTMQLMYYRNRACANLKLKNYGDVISDVNTALEFGALLEPELPLWKGIACFQLGDYKGAQEVFLKGKLLEGQNVAIFDLWLDQCAIELQEIKAKEIESGSSTPNSFDIIRHEWYQTELYVTVFIPVKKPRLDCVSIQCDSKALHCKILKEGEPDHIAYILHVNLAHRVNPVKSKWRVGPAMIDIQMEKLESVLWKTLRGPKENINTLFLSSLVSPLPLPSSPAEKSWEVVASTSSKNEEIDKLAAEGDEFVQELQCQRSEELRRAMDQFLIHSGVPPHKQ